MSEPHHEASRTAPFALFDDASARGVQPEACDDSIRLLAAMAVALSEAVKAASAAGCGRSRS